MEDIENIPQTENQVTINNETKDYLLETCKWGRLIATVGYVGVGFLILAGVGVMVGFSVFKSIAGGIDFPMGVLGLVYILMAALYFFPINYLYRFSSRIKEGLNSNNEQSVTWGFKNLKSLFKFMGILTIVVLSIYGLLLIIVLPLSLLFFR